MNIHLRGKKHVSVNNLKGFERNFESHKAELL